eukprot:COSAG06_NODE_21321_length_761_cov_0.867069_2_plen_71_part_00
MDKSSGRSSPMGGAGDGKTCPAWLVLVLVLALALVLALVLVLWSVRSSAQQMCRTAGPSAGPHWLLLRRG